MNSTATPTVYVAPGMPPLDMSGPQLSRFEFWPTWLVYAPVALQWLWLALRYRSLTLPLVANPCVSLSGMVGSSKHDLLALANPQSRQWIMPWVTHQVDEQSPAEQGGRMLERLHAAGIGFPLVGKPDLGCRGAGVKLLHDQDDLQQYLRHFPAGARFLLQKLAPWEPEAGVFYVRRPDESRGRIISLAFKYSPYVVGDGQRTLAELLEADPRAGQLRHLYDNRHQHRLQSVIAAGEPYRLVFSASHCRGAIFRNGGVHVTPALEERIDSIMAGIPEFHFGRLDVKFRSIEQLMRGEDLAIVEINGASSEPLHIWDRQTRLGEALRALLAQYRTLFQIGHQNRSRGHRTPGIRALLQAWHRERQLVAGYPDTD